METSPVLPMERFEHDHDRQPDTNEQPTEAKSSMLRGGIRSMIGKLFGGPKLRKRQGRPATSIEALPPIVMMSGATQDVDFGERPANAPMGTTEMLNVHPSTITNDTTMNGAGTEFATAGADKLIKLIDVSDGSTDRTLKGHVAAVTAVEYAAGGTRIVSTGLDKTLRIWDRETGKALRSIALPDAGTTLNVASDGTTVAVGLQKGNVRLYNIATGAVLRQIASASGAEARMSFSPDGKTIAVNDAAGVSLYEVQTGKKVRSLLGQRSPVQTLEYHPSGDHVATGDASGRITIWNTRTGMIMRSAVVHGANGQTPAGVRAMAFTYDGERLISAGRDGLAIVSDIGKLGEAGSLTEKARYKAAGAITSIDVTNDDESFLASIAHPTDGGQALFALPPEGGVAIDFTVPNFKAFTEELTRDIAAAIENTQEETEALEKPDISILDINGNNVTVAVRSPSDATTIAFSVGGAFSTHRIDHPGGTGFAIATVTFDKGLPSGTYALSMYEGERRDEAQDAINLQWDQRARTLWTTNPDDAFVQQLSAVEGMDEERARWNAMANLQTATLGDAHINWMQQIRFYQATADLPAPYNFSVDGRIDELIYAVRPEFRPENHQREIERMQAMKPKSTAAQIRNTFYNQLSDFNREVRDAFAVYERAIGETMQHCINILIDARKGGPNEVALWNAVHDAMKKWTNPQNLRQFRADSTALAKISLVNVAFPSLERLLEASKRTLDKQWSEMLQREKDVVAFRDYTENMLEKGLRQTADNQWKAVSKFIQPPKEMSRSELSLAAKIAKVLKESNDPRIVMQREAEREVMTLGVAEKLVASATDMDIANGIAYLMSGIDRKDMGKIDGRQAPERVGFLPEGKAERTFEINDESMVNFWVDARQKISLILKNQSGQNVYESEPGERNLISTRLKAGKYTLSIVDGTAVSPLTGQGSGISMGFDINMDVNKFASQQIEGRIGLLDKTTMPIKMSVAKFDNAGQRIKNLSTVDGLNPKIPVLVVIHGRTDRPDSNNMGELAKQLGLLTAGTFQVVTIDWREAANDILRTPVLNMDIGDLENAEWTPVAGKWVGQQLLSMGFPPSKINGWTHSHGSFIGFFMAQWINNNHKNANGVLTHEKVGSMVALDSAKNPVFFGLGANIDEDSIIFRNVFQDSLAVKSSFLGSKNRAYGAHKSIVVTSEHINQITEHGFAVTTFADILQDMRLGKNQEIVSKFGFDENGRMLSMIPYTSKHDAWIEVRTERVMTPDGLWWKAQASRMRMHNAAGLWEEPIIDPDAPKPLSPMNETSIGSYIP